MKIKKDKKVTVRIASVHKDEIERRGLSVQKILDQWIDKEVKVELKIKPKRN